MEPTESRPIQAGGTRLENEIRYQPEAGALPADSAIFPSVAQEQSGRPITDRPWSVTMRKDGSKALAGERSVEAGEGAVQLRHEPPIFRSRDEGDHHATVRRSNPGCNSRREHFPFFSKAIFRAVQPISRAKPIGSSVCPPGLHDIFMPVRQRSDARVS